MHTKMAPRIHLSKNAHLGTPSIKISSIVTFLSRFQLGSSSAPLLPVILIPDLVLTRSLGLPGRKPTKSSGCIEH
jgi:hypothetical protein